MRPSRPVSCARGCELSLFLPAKVGNLDCTLCLDCVHACPHDNVAIATRLPALELVDARRRSGIGWLSRRRDIAALALVFVFGGLVNALGMTAPARAMEQGLAQILGARTEGPVLAVLFALVLVGIPLVLMTSAAALTAWVTGKRIGALPGIVTGYSVLADSAWRWCVAGALRISLAHRGPDGHSGRAVRRNRASGLGGTRGAAVAVDGDETGRGVSLRSRASSCLGHSDRLRWRI